MLMRLIPVATLVISRLAINQWLKEIATG